MLKAKCKSLQLAQTVTIEWYAIKINVPYGGSNTALYVLFAERRLVALEKPSESPTFIHEIEILNIIFRSAEIQHVMEIHWH